MFFEENATVFVDDFSNTEECVWEVWDNVSCGGERWCSFESNRGVGVGLVDGSVGGTDRESRRIVAYMRERYVGA